MTDRVIIYTDGACKGNPGPGGWGVFMQYRKHEKELYGGEMETTNNRMELMAAIMALEALKKTAQWHYILILNMCCKVLPNGWITGKKEAGKQRRKNR